MTRDLLIALSVVLIAGCAFQGALRQQALQTPVAQDKIPLKVALVVAEPFRSQQLAFKPSKPGLEMLPREIRIELNPGLTESIRGVLSGLFQEVTVIVNTGEAGNADLLVFPTAEVQAFRPVVLTLTFRHSRTQAFIGRYDDNTTVNWIPPLEADAAEFLTGFSVFTLTPLTVSWEASVVGNSVIQRVQEAMASNLDSVARKIQNDRAILLIIYASF